MDINTTSVLSANKPFLRILTRFSKAVRKLCVFARHDLSSDPPFSNLDLISCRNVLIYLEEALQKRSCLSSITVSTQLAFSGWAPQKARVNSRTCSLQLTKSPEFMLESYPERCQFFPSLQKSEVERRGLCLNFCKEHFL